MEIRNLALISLLAATASADQIRHYPLDPNVVFAVTVSVDAPTTCAFPSAISALEAANVSMKADDHPPILLSHQPGASFFSVRALTPEARAAVNVIHQGRVFVIDFVAGENADRAVRFEAEPVEPTDATPGSLITRTRHYAELARQQPSAVRHVQHAVPGNVTRYRNFQVTIAEVCRYELNEILVLRLRVHNTGKAVLRLRLSEIAVRVGHHLLPAIATEGAEIIAPGREVICFAAFSHTRDDNLVPIASDNLFSAIVPTGA